MADALRIELLGPETPTEELQESPLSRYVAGMLAPFGTEVAAEESGDELTADADGEGDSPNEGDAPVSQALTPSSIGLSFLVSEETQSLQVFAEWGEYHIAEVDDGIGDATSVELEASVDAFVSTGASTPTRRPRKRQRWRRVACAPEPIALSLQPENGLRRSRIAGHDGIAVEWVCRKVERRFAVSIFLVNRRKAPSDVRPPADLWVFQPTLTIQSSDGSAPFLPRELEPALAHSDRDSESNRLLFRNRREYAVGHGCAAHWRILDEATTALVVGTELLPCHELPRIDAPTVGNRPLDMDVLSAVRSLADLRPIVEPLLDAYGEWIAEKRRLGSALESSLRAVAASHLDECDAALARMRRGVELLGQDEAALEAFRFANRAMLLQRAHTVWSHERRRDPARAPASPVLVATWRPFQLAFILLNLPALIDPASTDRGIGDLLWFPTGGGKTEAYLGLAAFVMALRRRQSVPGMRTDAGTSVLMRYTLRLLTVQQFQRAATLLCACESIRAADKVRWGEYRFSLGLWLGMDGTPNSHSESRRALLRLQNDPTEEGANPCVLETCPWCGEGLAPEDYWTDGRSVRTRVACPRVGCPFSRRESDEGIPVVVVDEEIYRECPSMVLATVDKFAQMPWKGEVQSLFGIVDRECEACGFLAPSTDHARGHRKKTGSRGAESSVRESERLAPPDLIIQDELHLISGPLGTLVGLYEVAVDHLSSRPCGSRLVGPKIIASTATVRRAFEQVQAIFDRTLRVFPPPGLEPQDSFFAVERSPSDEAPGRLYAGVCCPGKSMATAYVRVAAALLSAGSGLRDADSFAEPYLTLVSYFNSLRELGGAIRLMDDDIPARLDQLRHNGHSRRQRPVYVELTSRVRQEAIPQLLRRLEQRHDAPRSGDEPLPLDAVLASNMISVGVDIDRLGLMIVRGQPKTSAEYIQATSRVGRQPWGPGLVVTVYNWARPRDLSHYERFLHYHATLYRNVEAVSATPFSSRALDRGLCGAFVAMTRLGSDELSAEGSAARFDPDSPEVAFIEDEFRARAERVTDASTASALSTSLRGLCDQWWSYGRGPLRYGWRSPDPTNVPQEDVLLRVPGGGRIGHWPAPQSLREVEEMSLVRVLGLDD